MWIVIVTTLYVIFVVDRVVAEHDMSVNAHVLIHNFKYC